MEMTFTGRGMHVSDEIRATAERKLAHLERLEPRLTRVDVELIDEANRRIPMRVEAAVRIPRKTFRAHAEADDVPTALDRVVDKLERQLRDHHGKRRRFRLRGRLDSGNNTMSAGEDRREGA